MHGQIIGSWFIVVHCILADIQAKINILEWLILHGSDTIVGSIIFQERQSYDPCTILFSTAYRPCDWFFVYRVRTVLSQPVHEHFHSLKNKLIIAIVRSRTNHLIIRRCCRSPRFWFFYPSLNPLIYYAAPNYALSLGRPTFVGKYICRQWHHASTKSVEQEGGSCQTSQESLVNLSYLPAATLFNHRHI